MAASVDLQGLVTDYLATAGAAVAPLSYALVEVLLPDRLAAWLGGRSHMLLAFDLEVAKENSGAEFITFGHPFLDRVLEGCLQLGRTIRYYAAAARLVPPSNLQSRIEAALHFVGARGVRLVDTEVQEQHAAQFHFRLTLQADEKRQQMAGVLLDLHTALPLDHLVPSVARTFWDTRWTAVLPSTATVPETVAYRAARQHLERSVLREALAGFERELRPHRDRELNRVHGYYDGLMTDLRRRLELAGDPEKRSKLEQKLAATEADRERRTKDLQEKYSPRGEATLEAVTWYVWPRVRLRLLVDRRTAQQPVEAWYDLMANCVQPVPCARCGNWLYRLELTAAGEPCCPGGCVEDRS